MLTKCPHCDKAIVIPQPGLHDCPRCNARIWIYGEDSENEDKVVVDPQVIKQYEQEREVSKSGTVMSWDIKELAGSENKEYLAPWERKAKLGILNALFLTFKLSLLYPGYFYSKLKVNLPIKGVAFYGWFCMTIGYICWSIYRLAFLPFLVEATRQTTGEIPNEANMHLMVFYILISSPLLSLVAIYGQSLLSHLVVKMVGVKKADFRATFRVVVYATSPMILLAIPVVGDFIAFVWSMILTIVGISRVYRVSNPVALLVVLLPPIAFYMLLLLASTVFEQFANAPMMVP